ncbi:MAG: ABC transporter ATP-binding protein [Methylobacteriaceae bacterium]|nr:ABC transporter ATP-binding protein [Methylobacteriaceae bacterium]
MVGSVVPGRGFGARRAFAQSARRRNARYHRCPGASINVLAVNRLTVHFSTRRGTVQALDRVSLEIAPGEIVGLVGESGSGKSVLSYAISGLLDSAARIVEGSILWQGRPIGPIRERRTTRASIAQIFQSPRASLNPIRTIGRQLADVAGKDKVRALLESVRIDPERVNHYPFELSGGQCQRVGIALALGCDPELLIADEPTTGLDVTTEAAVMALIDDLSARLGMATLLVTHNLALAAAHCDRIVVMHAGQIVESAPVASLIAAPMHPYAAQLLAAIPQYARSAGDLVTVPGLLPDLIGSLPACRFARRCSRHAADCDESPPPLMPRVHDHLVACRHPLC